MKEYILLKGYQKSFEHFFPTQKKQKMTAKCGLENCCVKLPKIITVKGLINHKSSFKPNGLRLLLLEP